MTNAVISKQAEHSVLRIEIEGAWECSEFAELFSSLSRLYWVQVELAGRYFSTAASDPHRHLNWERMTGHRRSLAGQEGPIYPSLQEGLFPKSTFQSSVTILSQDGLVSFQAELAVLAIEYGSPGFADLAGLGKAMEEIRKFLEVLIKRRDDARLRAAQDERYELENQKIKLENARAFVSLAEEIGLGPEDTLRLVSYVNQQQSHLSKLVGTYKVVGVREMPYTHGPKFDRPVLESFRPEVASTLASDSIGASKAGGAARQSEERKRTDENRGE